MTRPPLFQIPAVLDIDRCVEKSWWVGGYEVSNLKVRGRGPTCNIGGPGFNSW